MDVRRVRPRRRRTAATFLAHGVTSSRACTWPSPTRRRSSLSGLPQCASGLDRAVRSDGHRAGARGAPRRTAPQSGCVPVPGRRSTTALAEAVSTMSRRSKSTRPSRDHPRLVGTPVALFARRSPAIGRVMFTSGTTGGRRASRSPRPTTPSPDRQWPQPAGSAEIVSSWCCRCSMPTRSTTPSPRRSPSVRPSR